MKLEGPMPHQQLSVFASGSLRMSSRSDLEEFLENSSSADLVRKATYQDLFLAIKTVGLGDSQELLILATPEQRCGFIDLDCWRKDSFHRASFLEWLAAYLQCGPEEIISTARAADPQILALFLKENVDVHVLEVDEPHPALPLILTPDQRFGIEITGEGTGATITRLLLDAIFRFDPSLGYELIDQIRWDQRISLEEEAYQNKRRRLEEIGFVDYYEALSIYQEIGEVVTSPVKNIETEHKDAKRVSSTLPALFVASLAPGQYLWRALHFIQDQREVEVVSQQLAALANRILSVHSVTPGDLEKIRPALEEMRDTLNLGFEHLTHGQTSLAPGTMKQNNMQAIFRVGFNVIADLRTQADRVISQGHLGLKGVESTLLESPYREFLDGLRRYKPLFFEGVRDRQRSDYQNFSSLLDIEVARQTLREIEMLGQVFWRYLAGPRPEWPAKSLEQVNFSLDDLRFGMLFATSVLNQALGKPFRPEPMTVSEMGLGLKKLMKQGTDSRSMTERFIGAGHRQFDRMGVKKAEQKILKQFIKSWSLAAVEELDVLYTQDSINPQWVGGVLLKLPESC